MHAELHQADRSPADAELVSRWKAGSVSAFEGLVRRHQPRLLAFLERSVGNRQDAEDVTQRVFVTIHQQVERFQADHSFTTWMFMIARRQATDHHRRAGSRERTLRRAQSLTGEDEAIDLGAAVTLDQRERSLEIWAWVREHLNERAFTALWLQVQEDMDDREIARALRLTRVHVRVLLHRARKKLVHARRQSNHGIHAVTDLGHQAPATNLR
jgi:RNA polymerase sigma-70 factor (ECF subfamily)